MPAPGLEKREAEGAAILEQRAGGPAQEKEEARMEKMLPEALLKLIKRVEENFPEDPKMVQLFVNCFTNTLDTTVKRLPDKTTYIITGDYSGHVGCVTAWHRYGLI